MRSFKEAVCWFLIFFLLVSTALAVHHHHNRKWGETAPPGCIACPAAKEGLFDTPICGVNGIAYKNYCHLTLRNCMAKKLKKKLVQPSKNPATCGLQTKLYSSFGGGKKRKRAIQQDDWLLNLQ